MFITFKNVNTISGQMLLSTKFCSVHPLTPHFPSSFHKLGGVITYISSSSSASSPESYHSDSSNSSYQPSSPVRGSSPSHSQLIQPAKHSLTTGDCHLPETPKTSHALSSGKCGISSKANSLKCSFRSWSAPILAEVLDSDQSICCNLCNSQHKLNNPKQTSIKCLALKKLIYSTWFVKI